MKYTIYKEIKNCRKYYTHRTARTEKSFKKGKSFKEYTFKKLNK